MYDPHQMSLIQQEPGPTVRHLAGHIPPHQENIGLIWDEATLKKEKQIVHTLLEAVYLDSEVGPVVSVKPKAEFRVLFELASDVSFVEDEEPRRDDA
jgi:hypothetical protein